MNKAGYLLSVCGADGSGKTTMVKHMTQYYTELGYDVLVTKEPGGTMVSNQIREIIINEDPAIESIHPVAQLLLLLASRVQHISKTILPALAEGKLVITDRFIDSTYVYQGKMNKLDYLIENLTKLYGLYQLAVRPDYTFFYDISKENSLIRSRHRGTNGLDEIHFSKEVSPTILFKAHFNKLADRLPKHAKLITLDANLSMDSVKANTLKQCYAIHQDIQARSESSMNYLKLSQHTGIL